MEIISGYKPTKIVKSKKGNKQYVSNLFKSLKLFIEKIFILPNNNLFNNTLC